MAAYIFRGVERVHFCQPLDETDETCCPDPLGLCPDRKSGDIAVCCRRIWFLVCHRKYDTSCVAVKTIVFRGEQGDVPSAFFVDDGCDSCDGRNSWRMSGTLAATVLVSVGMHTVCIVRVALAVVGRTKDTA